MSEQLELAGIAPAAVSRGSSGKFQPMPRGIPASAEVATIDRAYGSAWIGQFGQYEYPNLSPVVLNRSFGEGIRIYRRMMFTDADLSGLFDVLFDDVLHSPWVVRAASDAPDHQLHARFQRYALSRIPHFQNVKRHFLSAYPYGFSVTEKMYSVVDRGEWSGAVIWSELRDKPAHWFTFDPDRQLRFRTLGNYSPGQLLDQRKFIVTTFGTNSDPWGEAMLGYCYWPWLLRHQAYKNQAIYMDKWASPTGKVTYESGPDAETNRTNRAKAIRVMQAIQSDQTIAVPKGMDASLMESMRNGSVSYDQYLDQLWQTISRRVTGQILTGTGSKGGSYAAARVHAEQMANKVEMLAMFLDSWVSRECRELIDRNFGPQDAYPSIETLARDLVFKQGYLEVEQMMMANGHQVSKAYSDLVLQTVLPTDAGDNLIPSATAPPGQAIPVSPQLAAGDGEASGEGALGWKNGALSRARATLAARMKPPVLLLAKHRDLHAHAKAKAVEIRSHLEKIGATATAKAKPAIHAAVKSVAARVRKKTTAKSITRAYLLKGIQGYDGSSLGGIFHTMLDQPANVSFAAGLAGLSYAAKLAYALQMFGIVESVAQAADDAPDGMDAGAFADSLTDPNGAAVDQTHINLFEGTHSTNIASVATGALRDKLADPAYRKANPYVMIVVTNPDARLGHRMMDGFILSAEEARYSPFLPPFSWGCDCQAVPISKEIAVEMGITGSAPAGTLDEYLAEQGAKPSRTGGYTTPSGDTFTPGTAPGFRPAFADTDTYAQLDALRAKADELARTEPDGWASWKKWLLALFGMDILTTDPPAEDTNA